MADQLKRCSEHLRKAAAYLSGISGTPQEKLRGMVGPPQSPNKPFPCC
jgi:hypothetical protein